MEQMRTKTFLMALIMLVAFTSAAGYCSESAAVGSSLLHVFPASSDSQEGPLLFEVKNTGDKIKLRWLLEDKALHCTYKLWRAPADAPKSRSLVAELEMMDHASAKEFLGDADKAALKLIFPRETAKNRAEYNASLAQNANRLNLLAYLSLLKPRVARVLGQYYEDSLPEETKAFIYTLEVWEDDKQICQATRGVVKGQVDTPVIPHALAAHRFKWGVGLKWEGFEPYVGFNIFRSPFYEGPYQKINKNPVQVQASRNPDGTVDLAPYFYSDTGLETKGQVYYKIQGLDFFADPGPFSLPVAGKVKTDNRPAPLARPDIKPGETEIVISWGPGKEKDIIGYNIYRSHNYNEKGKRLNGEYLTEPGFVDRDVVTDMYHFYSVTAVNKGGYESMPSLVGQGLPKDSTPPERLAAAPEGKVFSGKKQEMARVELTWKSVAAPDLLGYRVYRTLKPENLDWALLNEEVLENPEFTDTMGIHLSRYPFYYRITSVDTHFNESAPSAEVKIQLPDVTPPKTPSITGSMARDGQVSLSWHPVKAYDLAGYMVYRNGGEGAEKLTPVPLPMTAFADTAAPVEKKLSYAVSAVDRAGNESQPTPWVDLVVSDSRAPVISKFNLKTDGRAVVVQVSSKDKDLAGFDLLRSRNQRDFVKCNSRRITSGEFRDEHVMKGKRYYYKVALWDMAGNRMESPAREIRIPR